MTYQGTKTYEQAMTVTDQAEADALFEALVEDRLALDPKRTREEIAAREREALGYWAGYYNDETRARVERLFRCAHPFLGAIAEKGSPSPEEALRIGIELGQKLRGGE